MGILDPARRVRRGGGRDSPSNSRGRRCKNIFGISTLALSAFFFYVVNILNICTRGQRENISAGADGLDWRAGMTLKGLQLVTHVRSS